MNRENLTTEQEGPPPSAETGDSARGLFPENRSVTFTTSGTAAFEWILRQESLRESRILFPAFTCKGAFAPLIDRYDIEPVFVDVDRHTRHLDVEEASSHLSSVDAVVLVHAFGLPVPTKPWIEDVAQQDDIVLIEDCARALGAHWQGRPVGSVGEYAIYSLSKVSPLFTGGCLATELPADSVALEAPAFGPDLLVKTVYDAVPWNPPFREQISTVYHATLGQQNYSETQYGLSENRDNAPIRRLDPINQWRAKRYLSRRFHRVLARRRAIAEDLRAVLERWRFSVQPDTDERVYHTLPATVPGDRETVLEFLESNDHAVRIVWEEPLGLEYAPARDYPVTAELAEQAILFPIADMTQEDVARLERDLEQFYGTVEKR